MNAARLRNLIEIVADRPNAARIAKAIAAVAKSELVWEGERTQLLAELNRNAELIEECGCVSYDGLSDCLDLAKAIERRSLVIELGKPYGEDGLRSFVARQHGREFRGDVFRGWSRLGGSGWMAFLPGVGMLSAHRSIEAAIRNAISIARSAKGADR